MNPSAYIETSVISYLTARPSRDLVVAAYQEVTRQWWRTAPSRFRLFASALVVDEVGRGDPTAARSRLRALHGIPLLEPTRKTDALARQLLDLRILPQEAADDAGHIAIAAAHRVEYLVTWNFRHIANAAMQASIDDLCRRAGHRPPLLCSPNELMELQRAQQQDNRRSEERPRGPDHPRTPGHSR